MKLVNLESVGSVLNIVDGMTFPMNADNTPDLLNPVQLEDCCDEWYMNLSPEDNVVVQDTRFELDAFIL